MSLVIVETATQQPLTDEVLQDIDERSLPCLEARAATWRYSLLSSDRQRMVCTFDAPDAEAVRAAYRQARLFSRVIWAGELIQPEGTQPQRDVTRLKVFEGTYPPLSEADLHEASSKILSCYTERGIEWIQTYLSRDRTRMICELNAPDAESVREVQRKVGIPFDRVWSAQVLSP